MREPDRAGPPRGDAVDALLHRPRIEAPLSTLFPPPPGSDPRRDPRREPFRRPSPLQGWWSSLPTAHKVGISLFVLVIGYSLTKRNPITEPKLVLFAVVVPSIVLHELAHAATALAFGDDTAKRAGRITLNPLKHGAFGILVLPALLVLSGGYPMAFASTPVRPSRLRSPRNHGLLVSLAGPASNVAIAVAAAAALKALSPTFIGVAEGIPLEVQVLYALGFVNVILAVFNLLPFPPLDGSAIVERLLPREWLPAWATFRRWAPLVLLFVVFSGAGDRLLDHLFQPALRWWANLLR